MKKSASNARSRNGSRTATRRKPSARTTRSSQARGRAASRARKNINMEWLQDFMSEMLAVERGGVKLYEKALEELSHEDMRSKLEQFLEQTQRHVEICEEMLEKAGMGSDMPSPGAEAAEHKAQGLLSAEVPEKMADQNNLENLVLAETKDHWNWEMLSSLMEDIEDRELKRAVKQGVREAQRQERDHLAWTQKMVTKLATEEARRMPEKEEMEEEGESKEMTE
jgi:rubrerythrin